MEKRRVERKDKKKRKENRDSNKETRTRIIKRNGERWSGMHEVCNF